MAKLVAISRTSLQPEESTKPSDTEQIVSLLDPEAKRKETWANHFSLETVLSGGSLRRVAQNAFLTVQFTIGKHELRQVNAVHVCGKYKDVKELLQVLPEGLGEGIQALLISAPRSLAFTRSIANQCTGLRNLSFKPFSASNFPSVYFCAIVAACGSGLAILEVSDLHAN